MLFELVSLETPALPVLSTSAPKMCFARNWARTFLEKIGWVKTFQRRFHDGGCLFNSHGFAFVGVVGGEGHGFSLQMTQGGA